MLETSPGGAASTVSEPEQSHSAADGVVPPPRLTHLQRLEAEAIHIIRETVAECERPVVL